MHVPSGWLNSIAFLYPDTHSAESDQHGSTGFFVSHPAEDPALAPASYTYLVTNSHVAFEGACSYARINAVDGGTRLVDLRAQDWFHHPAGDDVAIMPIAPDASWSFTRIEASYLLTEHEAAHWGFGPGDEASFFGRYQPLSGSTTNRPVVRFGRVAAFPPVPTKHGRLGASQESILVEGRSLSGYSGSPVWAHLSAFPKVTEDGLRVTAVTGSPLWLIGINWGHHNWTETVRVPESWDVPPDSPTIDGNSGMMLVVPAWKLTELLSSDDLVAMRKEVEGDSK